MSHYRKVPVGSLVVDARVLKDVVVDLPRGAMQGMRTEQPGYEDVVLEIVSNLRALGVESGVAEELVDRLLNFDQQVALIDQILPAALKLVEILGETRAHVDDQRQRLVRAIAEIVEAHAKAMQNPSLLAKYEKTRSYRSASGIKAAKTRNKNIALAQAQEAMIAEAVEKAAAAADSEG